ncbi:MAG: hypothetical protein HY350_03185 [Candidatus Omnitrophica bacterium]|nr:hypothetical protein [Candidatus Omnitrophota bacterium]
MERINNFPDNSPDLHLLIQSSTMDELKGFFNDWKKEITRTITEEK